MKQFTVLATLFALWASASAAPNAEPEPFLGVHFGSQWLKGGVCTKGAGSDPGYCVLPVGATPTTDGAATDGSATQPQKRDDTHYPCTNMHPCSQDKAPCKVKLDHGNPGRKAHCSSLFGN